VSYSVTRTELDTLDTLCHGIVVRDGWEDACNKPATAVLFHPDAGPWPACCWHANRWGGAITLAELATARETGCVEIEWEAS